MFKTNNEHSTLSHLYGVVKINVDDWHIVTKGMWENDSVISTYVRRTFSNKQVPEGSRDALKRSCLSSVEPWSVNIVPHVHSTVDVNLSFAWYIYLLTVSLFLFDFASTSSSHSHCFSESSEPDRALTIAPFSVTPFCKFNLASSLFECAP